MSNVKNVINYLESFRDGVDVIVDEEIEKVFSMAEDERNIEDRIYLYLVGIRAQNKAILTELRRAKRNG